MQLDNVEKASIENILISLAIRMISDQEVAISFINYRRNTRTYVKDWLYSMNRCLILHCTLHNLPTVITDTNTPIDVLSNF